MKKTFRRFVAYFIDMMVIILIAQCLSGIPGLNPQLDDYNKYYEEYNEVYNDYASFKADLVDDFDDKELSEKEYNSLIEEHSLYEDILKENYEDGKLTEKEYNKINDKIDEDYNKEYKDLYYKIEKNSILYFIVYIVAVIGYFVGFNVITKGQTLGKKLMRLKVVNSKDDKKQVPIWSYIVRALILYQPVYYIVRLIGVFTLSMNNYLTVTSVFYDIQYYLEILIILMIIIRLDGRGPHDILAKTRVILYDKNGNEVEDKLDTMVSKKFEEVKQTKGKRKSKKIIDEEPSN